MKLPFNFSMRAFRYKIYLDDPPCRLFHANISGPPPRPTHVSLDPAGVNCQSSNLDKYRQLPPQLMPRRLARTDSITPTCSGARSRLKDLVTALSPALEER